MQSFMMTCKANTRVLEETGDVCVCLQRERGGMCTDIRFGGGLFIFYSLFLYFSND